MVRKCHKSCDSVADHSKYVLHAFVLQDLGVCLVNNAILISVFAGQDLLAKPGN